MSSSGPTSCSSRSARAQVRRRTVAQVRPSGRAELCSRTCRRRICPAAQDGQVDRLHQPPRRCRLGPSPGSCCRGQGTWGSPREPCRPCCRLGTSTRTRPVGVVTADNDGPDGARKSAGDETPFAAAATSCQGQFAPGFNFRPRIGRRCWRSAATANLAAAPKRATTVPNPQGLTVANGVLLASLFLGPQLVQVLVKVGRRWVAARLAGLVRQRCGAAQYGIGTGRIVEDFQGEGSPIRLTMSRSRCVRFGFIMRRVSCGCLRLSRPLLIRFGGSIEPCRLQILAGGQQLIWLSAAALLPTASSIQP